MWHGFFEELADTLTAAAGLVLAFVASPFLIASAYRHGSYWELIAFGVYALTLIALYCASTLYHGTKDRTWKRRFRVLDHSCIYLLIAGTYTPFFMLGIWDKWGRELLVAVWVIAFVGIYLKVRMFDQIERYSVAIYIALGWVGLLVLEPLTESLSRPALTYVFAGGILYSVGTIFYAWRTLPFHHSLWHIFVLLGSMSHFIAIFWYLPAKL